MEEKSSLIYMLIRNEAVVQKVDWWENVLPEEIYELTA